MSNFDREYFWAKNIGEIVYKDDTRNNNDPDAGDDEIYLLASEDDSQRLKDDGLFDDLPEVVVPE